MAMVSDHCCRTRADARGLLRSAWSIRAQNALEDGTGEVWRWGFEFLFDIQNLFPGKVLSAVYTTLQRVLRRRVQ